MAHNDASLPVASAKSSGQQKSPRNLNTGSPEDQQGDQGVRHQVHQVERKGTEVPCVASVGACLWGLPVQSCTWQHIVINLVGMRTLQAQAVCEAQSVNIHMKYS